MNSKYYPRFHQLEEIIADHLVKIRRKTNTEGENSAEKNVRT